MLFGIGIGLALGVGGLAAQAAAHSGTWAVIHACANKTTGQLRLADQCRTSEKSVSWNKRGPAGPQGPAGPSSLAVTMREVSRTVTVPAGGTVGVESVCNSGEAAISGGVTAWTPSLTSLDNVPTGPDFDGVHSGWGVTLINHTGHPVTATLSVSALCVPGSTTVAAPSS